jgi:hypothetical protein
MQADYRHIKWALLFQNAKLYTIATWVFKHEVNLETQQMNKTLNWIPECKRGTFALPTPIYLATLCFTQARAMTLVCTYRVGIGHN